MLQAERAMPWPPPTPPLPQGGDRAHQADVHKDLELLPSGGCWVVSRRVLGSTEQWLVEESGESEFTSWHGLLVANDLKPGHLICLSLCVLTGKNGNKAHKDLTIRFINTFTNKQSSSVKCLKSSPGPAPGSSCSRIAPSLHGFHPESRQKDSQVSSHKQGSWDQQG